MPNFKLSLTSIYLFIYLIRKMSKKVSESFRWIMPSAERKKMPLIFLFLLIPFAVKAQSDYKSLKGRVSDSERKPVTATVELYTTTDSLVKLTNTDASGIFYFANIRTGNYRIWVKALGYKDYVINLMKITADSASFSVPEITLTKGINTLKEVEIKIQKPMVEFRGDRVVLNVSNSINSASANALELLSRAPNIKLGAQEQITVSGKNGINVYVDGRNTNLSGPELSLFLQTIPSTEIESIEIISNPPAKYQANGNAGIINIKLKKNKNFGFNGNLNLASNFTDYRPKYTGLLSLNYRAKKVNFFGNYNGTLGKYRTIRENLREQYNYNDSLINYDQQFYNYSLRTINNFRLGADFTLNPKTTLSFLTNVNFSQTDGESLSNTLIYYVKSDIDNSLFASNIQPQSNNRFDYNVNYQYKDGKDLELTLDASYRVFKVASTSSQENLYYKGMTDELARSKIYNNNSSTDINVATFQTDYLKKIFTGFLGAGFSVLQTNSNNDFNFFNDNVVVRDSLRSSNFSYAERCLAAYLEYSVDLKGWQMRFGARTERVDAESKLTALAKEHVQNYKSNQTKIFPNALISTKLGKDNSLALAYNRRIDRPAFRNLNPFVFIQDELFYESGNPFLKPQYTHDLKISHFLKQKFATSFTFTNIQNYILTFRDTVGSTGTYESKINLSNKNMYAVATSAQLRVNSWYNYIFNLGALREKLKGPVGDNYLNLARNSFNVSGISFVSLSKSLKMEFSGRYNSRYIDAPAVIDDQWTFDFGMQKKVLKDAGLLRLGVSDIFDTWEFRFRRDFGGLSYVSYFKPESRQIRFSFNYNFGNKNVKASKSKDKGFDEASKRLK